MNLPTYASLAKLIEQHKTNNTLLKPKYPSINASRISNKHAVVHMVSEAGVINIDKQSSQKIIYDVLYDEFNEAQEIDLINAANLFNLDISKYLLRDN